MASSDTAFKSFYNRITPCRAKLKVIKRTRNALRSHIRHYFRDVLKLPRPAFVSQGALATGTLANPLSGTFAVDDGLHLRHLDAGPRSWPASEIAHLLLLKAVSGGGPHASLDQQQSILVCCSSLCRIHLFTYAGTRGRLLLAGNGALGWHPSPIPLLAARFAATVAAKGKQLPRIVCYVKAWADFNNLRSWQTSAGLLLTVLTLMNFEPCPDRDDLSLSTTICKIADTLSRRQRLDMPEINGLALADTLPCDQKKLIQRGLRELAANSVRAIRARNLSSALSIWRRQFGDRFPAEQADGFCPLPVAMQAPRPCAYHTITPSGGK